VLSCLIDQKLLSQHAPLAAAAAARLAELLSTSSKTDEIAGAADKSAPDQASTKPVNLQHQATRASAMTGPVKSCLSESCRGAPTHEAKSHGGPPAVIPIDAQSTPTAAASPTVPALVRCTNICLVNITRALALALQDSECSSEALAILSRLPPMRERPLAHRKASAAGCNHGGHSTVQEGELRAPNAWDSDQRSAIPDNLASCTPLGVPVRGVDSQTHRSAPVKTRETSLAPRSGLNSKSGVQWLQVMATYPQFGVAAADLLPVALNAWVDGPDVESVCTALPVFWGLPDQEIIGISGGTVWGAIVRAVAQLVHTREALCTMLLSVCERVSGQPAAALIPTQAMMGIDSWAVEGAWVMVEVAASILRQLLPQPVCPEAADNTAAALLIMARAMPADLLNFQKTHPNKCAVFQELMSLAAPDGQLSPSLLRLLETSTEHPVDSMLCSALSTCRYLPLAGALVAPLQRSILRDAVLNFSVARGALPAVLSSLVRGGDGGLQGCIGDCPEALWAAAQAVQSSTERPEWRGWDLWPEVLRKLERMKTPAAAVDAQGERPEAQRPDTKGGNGCSGQAHMGHMETREARAEGEDTGASDSVHHMSIPRERGQHAPLADVSEVSACGACINGNKPSQTSAEHTAPAGGEAAEWKTNIDGLSLLKLGKHRGDKQHKKRAHGAADFCSMAAEVEGNKRPCREGTVAPRAPGAQEQDPVVGHTCHTFGSVIPDVPSGIVGVDGVAASSGGEAVVGVQVAGEIALEEHPGMLQSVQQAAAHASVPSGLGVASTAVDTLRGLLTHAPIAALALHLDSAAVAALLEADGVSLPEGAHASVAVGTTGNMLPDNACMARGASGWTAHARRLEGVYLEAVSRAASGGCKTLGTQMQIEDLLEACARAQCAAAAALGLARYAGQEDASDELIRAHTDVVGVPVGLSITGIVDGVKKDGGRSKVQLAGSGKAAGTNPGARGVFVGVKELATLLVHACGTQGRDPSTGWHCAALAGVAAAFLELPRTAECLSAVAEVASQAAPLLAGCMECAGGEEVWGTEVVSLADALQIVAEREHGVCIGNEGQTALQCAKLSSALTQTTQGMVPEADRLSMDEGFKDGIHLESRLACDALPRDKADRCGADIRADVGARSRAEISGVFDGSSIGAGSDGVERSVKDSHELQALGDSNALSRRGGGGGCGNEVQNRAVTPGSFAGGMPEADMGVGEATSAPVAGLGEGYPEGTAVLDKATGDLEGALLLSEAVLDLLEACTAATRPAMMRDSMTAWALTGSAWSAAPGLHLVMPPKPPPTAPREFLCVAVDAAVAATLTVAALSSGGYTEATSRWGTLATCILSSGRASMQRAVALLMHASRHGTIGVAPPKAEDMLWWPSAATVEELLAGCAQQSLDMSDAASGGAVTPRRKMACAGAQLMGRLYAAAPCAAMECTEVLGEQVRSAPSLTFPFSSLAEGAPAATWDVQLSRAVLELVQFLRAHRYSLPAVPLKW
jgi:hypothetical protein